MTYARASRRLGQRGLGQSSQAIDDAAPSRSRLTDGGSAPRNASALAKAAFAAELHRLGLDPAPLSRAAGGPQIEGGGGKTPAPVASRAPDQQTCVAKNKNRALASLARSGGRNGAAAPVEDSSRPLFIPLKAEWFEAFDRGEKDTEFRRPRGAFALAACWPGRKVLLSYGYSGGRDGRRRTGRIVHRELRPISECPPAAQALYRGGIKTLIAIRIELDPK